MVFLEVKKEYIRPFQFTAYLLNSWKNIIYISEWKAFGKNLDFPEFSKKYAQSLRHALLLVVLWTLAHQAPLSMEFSR